MLRFVQKSNAYSNPNLSSFDDVDNAKVYIKKKPP